ncbi:MAG: hypothetical protein ACI9S8_000626 [Chlamydiales bacterium]|jgi:hypothetical protein
MTLDIRGSFAGDSLQNIHLPDQEMGLMTETCPSEEQIGSWKKTKRKVLKLALPTVAVCGTIALGLWYATSRIEGHLSGMQGHFDGVIGSSTTGAIESTQRDLKRWIEEELTEGAPMALGLVNQIVNGIVTQVNANINASMNALGDKIIANCRPDIY